MLKFFKKNNYFYFSSADKILKTPLNNAIMVETERNARRLLKSLQTCIKSKNKEKVFFLEILYFYYDLNKENREFFIKKLIDNLNTDLLCYRANKNSELEEIQKKKWDPLLLFVKKKYKLSFKVANSIMPFNQDPKNILKLHKILKNLGSKKFTTYYFITNFSNSNIITLNFLLNNINSNDVWDYLSLEETYNLSKWGYDEEAKSKLFEKKKYFDEIVNFKKLFNIQ